MKNMWTFLGCFVLLQISCSFVYGDPKVPCFFIFGDSLFDVGNNNDLDSKAKANYAPYGVDFPGGVATGRFTNGITSADALTKILGFRDFIPPFSNASGKIILKGVNYASGSAGLLAESGSHLGDRIWLSRQVKNHGTTIKDLKSLISNETTVSKYLNKCLYLVNMGSNDYINNYFMPEKYNSSKNFTPRKFSKQLVAEYEKQLQELYNFGARRTAIFGLAVIGCIPAERRMHNETSCVRKVNNAVKHFNNKLRHAVDSWNTKLDGAKFMYFDLNGLQSSSHLVPGLKQADPCCKLRTSDYQCEASIKPCGIRAIHAFYDGFHPTQLLNKLTAQIAFNPPFNMFVHPQGIKALIGT